MFTVPRSLIDERYAQSGPTQGFYEWLKLVQRAEPLQDLLVRTLCAEEVLFLSKLNCRVKNACLDGVPCSKLILPAGSLQRESYPQIRMVILLPSGWRFSYWPLTEKLATLASPQDRGRHA